MVAILGRGARSDEFWKSTMRHYSALVSVTDSDVGVVLRALGEAGAIDNTIIVFLADHGDTCGAHGFLSKGVIAYEELIRIPLILSWPDRLPRSATCDRLASIMDVFPTLAEAAGITLPSDLDGRSLMPLLENRPVPDWRTSLVIAHHGNMYGFCTMRAVVGERLQIRLLSLRHGGALRPPTGSLRNGQPH